MKHFYARVTTQYDGLEWTAQVTIRARNKENAIKAIDKMNLTHFDRPQQEWEEQQYPVNESDIQEITKEEFETLRRFHI